VSDLRTRIAAVVHRLDPEVGCVEIEPVSGWAYEVADAIIRELPELQYAHVPQRVLLGPLKALQHQQASKELRDPDMIAADQEWGDKHAACLGCGLPLPHAAGECKRGDR
jgi:hypothetical protein